MPKQANAFKWGVIAGAKLAAVVPDEAPSDQRHPRDDVDPMQSRHAKIKGKIQCQIASLGMPFIVKELARKKSQFKFMRILDVFDDQEDPATDERNP